MKRTAVSQGRRKFFAKAGAGLLAGSLLGTLTETLTAREKKTPAPKGRKVSLSINPMAVKRTKKG